MGKRVVKYRRPYLNGYKVLYKGRRFWVFEISNQTPFGGAEEFYNLIAYDCLNDCILITAVLENNKITGDIPVGQDSLEVTGKDVSEFLARTLHAWKRVDPSFR